LSASANAAKDPVVNTVLTAILKTSLGAITILNMISLINAGKTGRTSTGTKKTKTSTGTGTKTGDNEESEKSENQKSESKSQIPEIQKSEKTESSNK